MSIAEDNRKAIIAYFESGSKGQMPCDQLGVEVEHFVVDAKTLRAVTYEGADGGLGVRDVLEYLLPFYPQETRGLEGDLIGLANGEASLTLEPAAQLEISIAPFCSIASIVAVYQQFRSRIDPFLEEHGCKLMALGYHPMERACDLPLIPKRRYHFMDDYFHALGTHGERMMRASASTQVSIDYRDETDAVRKMRIAQALTPIFAAITDNIERFEGVEPEGALSHLAMWRDVDNARCGQVPGLFDEGFGFESYARWLLNICPIFVTRPSADDTQGPALRSVAGQSAGEAYGDAMMSEKDIEHLLSMVWPDIRLKRFVEIRPADALGIEAVAGYAALIKGLFYSEDSLRQIEGDFGVIDNAWPLDDDYTDSAMQAIRTFGSSAVIYGRTLGKWEEVLFGLARKALSADERRFLAGLENRPSAR